ncbi:hypothetical protein H8D57_03655 [bacterium]|nr:hypothetical protein [bacterium]
MKLIIGGMLLWLFLILPFGDLKAEINFGMVGSVGLPQGFLDYSFDAYLFTRYSLKIPLKVEFGSGLNGSFQTHQQGGKVGFISIPSYLLARYEIKLPITELNPFISVGTGMHLIYSLKIGENRIIQAISDMGNPFRIVCKVHILFGFNYSLGSNWFLMTQGRITYPSDIILDSGYLGLGFKF